MSERIVSRQMTKRDIKVFESIFGWGLRHKIRWGKFVMAMRGLGFVVTPAGKHSGSGRHFKPPAWITGGTMRLDEPHDRIIWPDGQADLARRLNNTYTLSEKVAITQR